MSAQENKILSNRVAQAISEGDLEALDELMAQAVIARLSVGPEGGDNRALGRDLVLA